VPVDVKTKLRAVVEDLGSQAKVAELLGVSRSRVSRWLRTGEEPDEGNRRALQGIEVVLARLYDAWPDRDVAMAWLYGLNPDLENRRPITVLRRGRVGDVLEALDSHLAGGYG
jgi:transcriptional regulator with XRE-family HTH domain